VVCFADESKRLDKHDVPTENVLVELFPYPKRLWGDTKDRLAAGITDADGRYCFGNIPKGRYQIRASKDGGFQITFVNVYVDPNNRKASDTELDVSIELGY